MMVFLGMVLAAFVCFALVFFIKQRQYNHPALRMPYQLHTPLFAPEERALLTLLEQAVGEQYRVFAKVRLADVVDVTAVPRRAPWYQAHNRISASRFDFLLCDPASLAPVCAIEMEAGTPANAFMDELCQTIGLPMVRLPAETARSYDRVKAAIEQAVAAGTTTLPQA
ncbi:DUF2726 domain-containing protein [Stutzerimonas chloritidismutans]|uniref:DUF2726 domain-containing protein n=1 Tax=Stutzerimonas chloritidismutans TaxID=203192 RepID=UPI003F5CF16A